MAVALVEAATSFIKQRTCGFDAQLAIGVVVSSGAVAYGIIALLPVELILQAGSHTGFAMVFALLLGAIVWNLGTWYLGLPASSSHTLIGSIIGVGLMNQLMAPSGAGASGVDWGQTAKIGYSLLLSPLVGFAAAALRILHRAPRCGDNMALGCSYSLPRLIQIVLIAGSHDQRNGHNRHKDHNE